MYTVSDEEIVDAILLCSADKGFTTYTELSEIVDLQPSTLVDRLKRIRDVKMVRGKHKGQRAVKISFPQQWPNEN